MKPAFLLFCLFSSLVLSTSAQKMGQERIDSLIAELPLLPDDTNKVNHLNDICKTDIYVNPSQGIQYGQQSMELAKKLGFERGYAFAASRIGLCCEKTNAYSDAMKYHQIALDYYNKLGDKKGKAGAFNNMGNIYLKQSDLTTALDHYLKALKINEEIGNKPWMAINLSNIGTIYQTFKDYNKSLEYNTRALKLNEEMQVDIAIANNLSGIGIDYYYLKDYDNAFIYFTKSLALHESFGNVFEIGSTYCNLGNVHQERREYERAMECYHKSLQIAKDLDDKTGISLLNGNIAALYHIISSQKNPESVAFLNNQFHGSVPELLGKAILHLDTALVIGKEINDIAQMVTFYESRSKIYKDLGQTDLALENYMLYTTYKDSMFNMEKDKKLTQLSMQYDFDKKEAATRAEQEKKDAANRAVRNAFIIGLVVALIFVFFLLRQQKKTQQAKIRAEQEHARSEELLLNILPLEVAEELKTTGRAKTKAFTMVTVMFTDFKGFTSVSEKIGAELLVDEIHYCFSAFDAIIQKYQIEKIKTIGDAYLCAAGLPIPNHSHANDIIKAAVEIRDFMEARKKEKEAKGELPFEIRIGVHTGPVVAGIVGVKKYAYDIWGDTVNLAARMEQNSEAGKINISGTTYELVKNNFVCQHRGKIEAKNKGMVDMYFVEPVKGA